MPRISIPVKYGTPVESIIDMANQLGKMTGTVVECQAVLEVTANEAVIEALQILAGMGVSKKRGKYKSRTKAKATSEELT
jgi:hypothetical protein